MHPNTRYREHQHKISQFNLQWLPPAQTQMTQHSVRKRAKCNVNIPFEGNFQQFHISQQISNGLCLFDTSLNGSSDSQNYHQILNGLCLFDTSLICLTDSRDHREIWLNCSADSREHRETWLNFSADARNIEKIGQIA